MNWSANSPALFVKVLRYVLTYFLTSSSLVRLNNFLIFDALFGPLILGFSMSVNPGRSLSPFFTITKFKTERSGLTMHPRTDFLLLSPFLLPWPRKQGVPVQTNSAPISDNDYKTKPKLCWKCNKNKPLWSKRRTRPGVSTPCFIGKPCLSQPPLILNTYPLNSCQNPHRKYFNKTQSKTKITQLLKRKLGKTHLTQCISIDFLWNPLIPKYSAAIVI